MKKIKSTTYIRFHCFENGEKHSYRSTVEYAGDGKIIVRDKNCYAYNFSTDVFYKENNLLLRIEKKLAGNPICETVTVEDPKTYYIGDYLTREEYKEKFGEENNIYFNMQKMACKGVVISRETGVKSPIYDDYSIPVSYDEVKYCQESGSGLILA